MSIRKATITLDLQADTDWRAVRVRGLGIEGYILTITYQLAAAGTSGSILVKVIDGSHDLPLTSAEIAAIPDNEVVLSDSNAIVAHATSALDVNVVGAVGEAAAYKSSRVGSDQQPLLAIQGDGVAAGLLTVTIRARSAR